MSTPLLATKLYIPPVRPRLVSRPHLIAGLNAGLHHKLTLVSAPAGFGKTTLLGEWAQRVGHPVAWLSLDEDDNDPVRFWRYLIAALQTVEPALGETALAALESPGPPPLEALATTLINEVTATSQDLYVLVLDDYHVVENAWIHQSLDFLLDHLPPQLHLVIATREDPPLSLARRRARAQLTELRVADLRFTAEDAAEFLNAIMDLELSVDEVAVLENRTEGWAVGLQMAALALRGLALRKQGDKRAFVAAFAGDDRYIGDYLIEEVLQHQPAHIQAFLLRTSILERLCGPLCDAVTGGTNGQTTLNSLEQANLFIVPLDSRRHWYRYHRLFADLLGHRLRQSEDAPGIASLHRRASEWYEREGIAAEAVFHALASSDLEYATALVERHAPDVASHGENLLAGNWLEALPEDRIRSSPFLCLLQAGYAESIELEGQWLQDAEKAWTERVRHVDDSEAADDIARVRFAGWMTASRVSLTLRRGGSPQGVIAAAHQALDHVPKDELVYNLRARSNILMALGHAHWRLDDEQAAGKAFAEARRIAETIEHLAVSIRATCELARIAYSRGRLHQAAEICRETLRSIAEPTEQTGQPLPIAGRLYIVLGTILLDWNDLEGADRALTKGLKLIELTQARSFQKDGYLALARLKQAQGDVNGAFAQIERVERLGAQIDPGAAAFAGRSWLSPAEQDLDTLAAAAQLAIAADSEAAALKLRLWLSQAERDPHYLAVAARFARERQIELDQGKQHSVEQLALVRLRIAQHRAQPPAQRHPDLAPVHRFLDGQLQAAGKKKRGRWMIEVLILQAMAQQVRGGTEQALSTLQRALTLAEPDGHIRVFADEGAPLARLLYEAASRGIAPGYVGKVLTAFQTPDQSPPPHAHAPSLIEPLSEREIEVLQLIAEGLSNRQIAQRLFISANTVRVHTSNIYRKLDVHSRTEALARARNLGLLLQLGVNM